MSPGTQAYVTEIRNIHGKVKLIFKGSSLKLCMVAEGFADCYPRFALTIEWIQLLDSLYVNMWISSCRLEYKIYHALQ